MMTKYYHLFFVFFVLLLLVRCNRSSNLTLSQSSADINCFFYNDSVGRAFFSEKEYDSALVYLKNALEGVPSVPESRVNDYDIARVFEKIGDVFYYTGEVDSSRMYYSLAMHKFEALDSLKRFSVNLNNLGVCFAIAGEYDSSLHYFSQSADISSQINDSLNIQHLYQNMGIIYGDMGNYPASVDYTLKSMQIAEQRSDSVNILGMGGNLVSMYLSNEDTLKALQIFEQTARYLTASAGVETLAAFYNASGQVYLEIKSDLDSAEISFIKLLDVSSGGSYKRGMSAAYGSLGNIAYLNEDYTQALDYYSNAIEIDRELNYPYGYSESYIFKARALMAMNENDKALRFLLMAKEAVEDNSIFIHLPVVYSALSDLYLALGNFEKSLEYYRFFVQEDNKIKGTEVQKQMLDIEAKYENEKKQRQIEVLDAQNALHIQEIEARNQIVLALSALMLVVFFMFFLLLRQNKLKAKNEKLELEQRLLRAQLRPHFIFNVLNSLKFFIQQKNEAEAISHLSSFSRLLRKTLHQSNFNEVSLANELEMLEDYVRLESGKFGGRLRFSTRVAHGVDVEKVNVLPFILQPFVENSLVHGFREMNGKLEINVEVEHDIKNKLIIISISDNGRGFSAAKEMNKKGSMGINIIRKRIKYFNKLNAYRGEAVEFFSSLYNSENKTGHGTTVRLCIAKKYQQ